MSPRTLIGPHFITTAPTITVCGNCGRPILAATIGGLDRHLDPLPLTAAGELAALLEQRPTFDLRGELLTWRSAPRIRAGRGQRVVLAAHTCRPPAAGHIDHAHLPAIAGLLRALHPTEEVTHDAPPF